MKSGFHHAALVLLLGATAASSADAAPTPAARAEIEQLMAQLADSGCEFQRNGEWHPGPEARKHLERKYAYLLKKDLVHSSEDFIERAATRSSLSGQPYQVRCGPGVSASDDWLRTVLGRIRSGR